MAIYAGLKPCAGRQGSCSGDHRSPCWAAKLSYGPSLQGRCRQTHCSLCVHTLRTQKAGTASGGGERSTETTHTTQARCEARYRYDDRLALPRQPIPTAAVRKILRGNGTRDQGELDARGWHCVRVQRILTHWRSLQAQKQNQWHSSELENSVLKG